MLNIIPFAINLIAIIIYMYLLRKGEKLQESTTLTFEKRLDAQSLEYLGLTGLVYGFLGLPFTSLGLIHLIISN